MKLTFGDPDSIARRDAAKRLSPTQGLKRIELMHERHGVETGRHCGECVHFLVKKWAGQTYFKCERYGNSNAASTDWRRSWIACGQFKKNES